jgi:DNA-binding LytR/AlgR family response regulator
MQKIKLLILEDDEQDAIDLKGYLSERYEIIAIAKNIEELKEKFEEQVPDLVILDVYIDGKPEGIQFAEYLNASDEKCPIIFFTSANDNITFSAAKKWKPCSYLLKPFNPLELYFSIELAFEKYVDEIGAFTAKDESVLKIKEAFFIKKNTQLYKVTIDDILYVEADGRYCVIFTDTDQFLVQQSLKDLSSKTKDVLVMSHRKYLVNLHKISNINSAEYFLTIQNGKTLPISQRHRKQVLDLFEIIK